MITISSKIIFIITAILVAAYKFIKSDDTYIINKLTHAKEIASVTTEALMFILLIIVFYPKHYSKKSKNAVLVSGHEKMIFLTLGIIGLLQLNWSVFLFTPLKL